MLQSHGKVRMKVHFIDILAAYLVCSYLAVTLVLLKDGTASFTDWVTGLVLAPIVAILYVPFYTLMALVNSDYFMFARGALFLVTWCVLTFALAYVHCKLRMRSFHAGGD